MNLQTNFENIKLPFWRMKQTNYTGGGGGGGAGVSVSEHFSFSVLPMLSRGFKQNIFHILWQKNHRWRGGAWEKKIDQNLSGLKRFVFSLGSVFNISWGGTWLMTDVLPIACCFSGGWGGGGRVERITRVCILTCNKQVGVLVFEPFCRHPVLWHTVSPFYK